MSNDKRFDAALLAKYLRDSGRKQRWLAEQIGTHESLVSEWVNGHRTVSERRARQVAAVLGVPFYLLFSVANASKRDAPKSERSAA